MKKGTVIDIMTIISLVFVIIIIGIIGLFMITKIGNAFSNMTGVPSSVNTIGSTIETETPSIFDFVFILIIVVLPLISTILAFFNNVHPLLFFLSVFLVILIIFAGIGYKAIWEQFRSTELGIFGLNNMPMTSYILDYFALYTVFCSFIILFGTYIKLKQGY